MKNYLKISLFASLLMAVILLALVVMGAMEYVPLLSVLTSIGLALGISQLKTLKMYQYTAWIVVAIIVGMFYPSKLLTIGGVNTRDPRLILLVVQLVMFGMGTQMSISYFKQIKHMKKAVLIGLLCQFTIMPLVGFGLTKVVTFEPEIASGVILIGCCASGLASNVMSFLAGANLNLSITLTAVATLCAPFMTPLLMSQLVGTTIDINFWDMFFNIIKIVIVPIGAAFLYDYYKTSNSKIQKKIRFVGSIALSYLLVFLFFQKAYGQNHLFFSSPYLELFNYLCASIVAGILFYYLTRRIQQLTQWMPYVSMGGIIYFTAITTAASRDNLMQIGVLLLAVAMVHNLLGYLLGYNFSRWAGLDVKDARTIALEVGMQNGGMASGLAGVLGKLATLGLAAAVFSPWMNISGSVLANYWKRKGLKKNV